MLQPHMINISIKIQFDVTYKVSFFEIKLPNVVQTAAITRASVQKMKETIRYAAFDSVRCLNGQYMAQNLSTDMEAAEFNEASIKK